MKKEFKAIKEELNNVLEFIHENSKEYVDERTLNKIDVVVEEIFVNIINYAYEEPKQEKVFINIENENNKIVITFEDNGIPFNPLDKEEPDITLKAEDRPIGGLGIYLVKKMMDNVEYVYKDNKNILIIEKRIDE